MTDNGARYPALGTFYQHTKDKGLEFYLVRHFKQADDRDFLEILETLGTSDSEITGLINQATDFEQEAHDLVWREKFPK